MWTLRAGLGGSLGARVVEAARRVVAVALVVGSRSALEAQRRARARDNARADEVLKRGDDARAAGSVFCVCF
jgi:orotidine-5'-phosphate decarboxylase